MAVTKGEDKLELLDKLSVMKKEKEKRTEIVKALDTKKKLRNVI